MTDKENEWGYIVNKPGDMAILELYWRPIESFDNRMFSLMSNGTPDTCEVVKYKGEIPAWATQWCPLPMTFMEDDHD